MYPKKKAENPVNTNEIQTEEINGKGESIAGPEEKRQQLLSRNPDDAEKSRTDICPQDVRQK